MAKDKKKNIANQLHNLQNAFNSNENIRLRQIIYTLTKYNVIINFIRQVNAEQIRAAFEELGPTFIKMGQILSVREDLLPQNFIIEFKKLQDNVKTDDFSVIRPIIESNSGMAIDELFEFLEEKALASASIAQVHVGRLKGGQQVVVKVQHPDIYDSMKRDISLLEKAIPLIEHIPNTDMVNISDMVAELKESLMLELDFNNEADNIEKFYKYNIDTPIVSPQVYKQYSNNKLLIMDYMQGMKISDYIIKADEKINNGDTYYVNTKKKLADILVNNYMKQIFDDGFFHADPHPGNILIYIDPIENDSYSTEKSNPFFDLLDEDFSFKNLFKYQDLFSDYYSKRNELHDIYEKIVYLDFGMMGYIDQKTLEKFNNIIASFSTKDNDKIAKAFMNICKTSKPVNMDLFTQDIGTLFSKYYDTSINNISIPEFSKEITSICSKYHLKIPSNITLMFKGISTIEGIVLQLDPDFSIMSAIEPYAKRYLKEKFDFEKEMLNMLMNLSQSGRVTPELPLKVSNLIDNVFSGKLKINVENKQSNDFLTKLKSMANRISISIIIAAFIIGFSIVIDDKIQNVKFDVNIGILIPLALILLCVIIYNIFKN